MNKKMTILNFFRRLAPILLIFLIFLMPMILTSCELSGPSGDIFQKVKQRGKILAGVKFDSRPFGFIDKDRKLKGFDIDLIKEIARRVLGNENAVDFQQVTSSNRIFSVSSGSVDLVAATMTINEKRKQVVDFSTPYYMAGQALMVPKNSSIKSVRDLKGKTVIVVLGTTSEKNIRELAPNALIKGFMSHTDAFSALRSGRGDALTTDDSIITGYLSESTGFKMLKERYTKEPYGIAFRKGKDSELLRQAVNKALIEMNQDGTLEKIRRNWVSKYT